jgi:glycosyltransferase involved in cell wall biosynthesis
LKTVNILQPYVPEYRVAFFDSLSAVLAMRDVRLTVWAGEPQGSQAARGDQVQAAPWLQRVRTAQVRVGQRSFSFPSPTAEFYRADGVICGLQGTLPAAYRATLSRALGRARVGLWGHVKNYVADDNAMDLAAERLLMRGADAVFAYTESGADFARSRGVPPGRVVTVRNAVDLSYIDEIGDALTDDDLTAFRRALGLGAGPVFGYVGGLDHSKRIDFLLDSFARIRAEQPDAQLVVLGRGDEEDKLQATDGQLGVVHVGFGGPREKVLLSRVATALLNPGRVGLIACEALALHLPIVTTEWPYHAPEIEYLELGRSVVISRNDPQSFAQAALSAPTVWAHAGVVPSLDAMVQNFADGIEQMLAGARD